MNEKYFTNEGKRVLQVAKESGLFQYYDSMMGAYTIPQADVDKQPELMGRIMDLLKAENSFGKSVDSQTLAMEMVPEIDDFGEPLDTWCFWLRYVEQFS